MSAYFFLPFYFLAFWFGEAPLRFIHYFIKVNKAFFQFFSVPLLLRTFFQPIKNEYRRGLVGFSIGMGIVLKTMIIVAALVLFVPVVILELLLLGGFLIFPLATVALFIW
jgi:hypothetical protein